VRGLQKWGRRGRRVSEEQEPLAFGTFVGLGDWRDVRKGAAFKGGERVFNQQSAGFLFAELFADGIVGKFEFERTTGGIVRVTGNEMYQTASNPVPGMCAGIRAENSHERARRNLRVTTLTNPFSQTFGLHAENRIALRMRDDRT